MAALTRVEEEKTDGDEESLGGEADAENTLLPCCRITKFISHVYLDESL